MASKQPMNPILGETHQCKIGDAICSLEQISHHPPISSFYLEGPGYTCSGNYQMKLGVGMPHLYMSVLGDTVVTFEKSGNVFKSNGPYVRIKGVVTGNKRLITEGTGFVWSKSLGFFSPIVFSPGGGGVKRWLGKPKDRDEVQGKAYLVSAELIEKFEQ